MLTKTRALIDAGFRYFLLNIFYAFFLILSQSFRSLKNTRPPQFIPPEVLVMARIDTSARVHGSATTVSTR